MQKKANPIGEADFRRRKTKDAGMFFSGSKWKLSYTHIFASQNSVKILTESSLLETKQTFDSIISNCICVSENCSTTSSPFFSFAKLKYSFEIKMSFFPCFLIWQCGLLQITLGIVLQYLYAFRKILGFCGWNFLPWILSSGLLATTSVNYIGFVFSSSENFCGRVHFPTCLFTFSILLSNTFVFLDVLWFFDSVQYRNQAAWLSYWYHFCDISILLINFWRSMEVTFSSWIMASRLPAAHKLRTSRSLVSTSANIVSRKELLPIISFT